MSKKTDNSALLDLDFTGINVAEELHYAGKNLPQVGGLKALILPGAFFTAVAELFMKAGFTRAIEVEEADVVVFTGGSDVSPEMYGQRRLQGTYCDGPRDISEKAVFDRCVAADIPMVGICRGAQILHVLNKGDLWQDVEGHTGRPHLIYDLAQECLVEATSIHHQMLRINDRIEVLAFCPQQVSRKFVADSLTILLNSNDPADRELEIEAGYYWDTKCFFVQGHPEVGKPEYQSWFMHHVEDFLYECAIGKNEDKANKKAS